MISLPLPFVVALFLLVLLGQMLGRRDEAPQNRLFLMMLGLHALQSVLVGLRWSYDMTWLLPIQAVLAAFLAALAWLCFRELASQDMDGRQIPASMHGLPALAVLVLIVLWPDGIDLVLIAAFLGYGAALLQLALKGPDALSRTSFEQVLSTYGALWATAATLILSALLEIAVSISITSGYTSYAGLIVAMANVLILLILGGAAAIAGRSQPEPEPAAEIAPAAPAREDVEIVAQLDEIMRTKRLFEDLDLNLERLARKTLIPARRISMAINRVKAQNVSQYINNHRIAEACHLLAETDEPVTTIMFTAGFQTKSNFNREFRRVTGMPPSEWRRHCLTSRKARSPNEGSAVALS